MAYAEINIPRLDIGAVESVEGFRGGWSFVPMEQRPLRLAILAADGTRIEADMPRHAPPDAIDVMEFVWLCIGFGGEGEDYEHAMADLRAAMAAQKARNREAE